MTEHTCYALKLEDDCYYVGMTKSHNLELRISQHFGDEFSSKWCTLHKPVKLIYTALFTTSVLAHKDEKRKTVELMRQHGIRKVRGADALCTRDWCYQKDRLFWVPFELRKMAEQGLLGELDIRL